MGGWFLAITLSQHNYRLGFFCCRGFGCFWAVTITCFLSIGFQTTAGVYIRGVVGWFVVLQNFLKFLKIRFSDYNEGRRLFLQ